MATNGNPFPSENGISKPQLFSMSQSRALLEMKRLKNLENSTSFNKSLLISPAHEQQRFFPPQQRQPLTSLLGNNLRTSTPIQAQASNLPHNPPAYYEDGPHNRGSSPSLTSSASPDRAYIEPNQSLSMSPVRQRIVRPAAIISPSQAPQGSSKAYDPRRRASTVNPDYNDALSILNSMVSKNEGLASEIDRLNLISTQSSRELADYRARLESVTQELYTANSEITNQRSTLATLRETLVARDTELGSVQALLSETKAELATVNGENGRLKEEVMLGKNESERLRKGLEISKEGVAKLSEAYSALGQSFKQLKQTYDGSQNHLHEIVKEVEETRKLARNGLLALEPMLDDNNTLSRAADTKAILKEFQDDLSASHQVTDLLRDKLLHNASQLADAHGRIRELEEEKRGSLKDLLLASQDEKRQFELLFYVEKQVAELSERLATREKETMDILANAASVEVELKALTAEYGICKSACVTHRAELQTLRVIKEENVSRLLALQDVINARDKEIVSFKAKLEALNESKAELQALMAEAKNNLAEKEIELRTKDPNEEFQIQIKDLRAKNDLLKSALQEAEKGLRFAQGALQTSENEFKTKIHEVENKNAELRMRNSMLQTSLEKTQRELKGSVDELKVSLSKESVMDGKCQILQGDLHTAKVDAKNFSTEIAELKERLEVQSVSLYQSKEECAKLKERVEQHLVQRSTFMKQQGTIVESFQKRAALAESNAASAQAQLTEANQNIKGLKGKIKELALELSSAKEAAILGATSTSVEIEEEIKSLKEKASRVERMNNDLLERADRILIRYKEGDLTDTERDFIGHLMSEAQTIHEGDVVLKNNELRRREHMIEALNSKVAELKGTVARFLKEKGGSDPGAVNKSMVDFKIWLPSSPQDVPEAENPSLSAANREDERVASTSASHSKGSWPLNSHSNVTQPASGNPADPKFSQLHDMDPESEEDIPLSELSRLTEDEGAGERVGTKRARSRSPPVDEGANRSKRRTKNSGAALKAAPARSISPAVQKKMAEGSAKSKQKKRK